MSRVPLEEVDRFGHFAFRFIPWLVQLIHHPRGKLEALAPHDGRHAQQDAGATDHGKLPPLLERILGSGNRIERVVFGRLCHLADDLVGIARIGGYDPVAGLASLSANDQRVFAAEFLANLGQCRLHGIAHGWI